MIVSLTIQPHLRILRELGMEIQEKRYTNTIWKLSSWSCWHRVQYWRHTFFLFFFGGGGGGVFLGKITNITLTRRQFQILKTTIHNMFECVLINKSFVMWHQFFKMWQPLVDLLELWWIYHYIYNNFNCQIQIKKI